MSLKFGYATREAAARSADESKAKHEMNFAVARLDRALVSGIGIEQCRISFNAAHAKWQIAYQVALAADEVARQLYVEPEVQA